MTAPVDPPPALIILGQTLIAHSTVVPRVGDFVDVPTRGRAYRVMSVRWAQIRPSRVGEREGRGTPPLVTMQASVYLGDE